MHIFAPTLLKAVARSHNKIQTVSGMKSQSLTDRHSQSLDDVHLYQRNCQEWAELSQDTAHSYTFGCVEDRSDGCSYQGLAEQCSGIRDNQHPFPIKGTNKYFSLDLTTEEVPEFVPSNQEKDRIKNITSFQSRTKNEQVSWRVASIIFMTERSPHLPIDLLFNLKTDEVNGTYQHYVTVWKQTANKCAARGKNHYDKKVHGRDLQLGDRVLIRNLTPRGSPGKIQSYWEDQVYLVKGRKVDNCPVYEVKPENGKGKQRVIHRNLLSPCDFLPLETATYFPPSKKTHQPTPGKNKSLVGHKQQQGSDSDSEEDYMITYPRWQNSSSEESERSPSDPQSQPCHSSALNGPLKRICPFMFLQKRICPFMFLQKRICPFMFLQKRICPFMFLQKRICPFMFLQKRICPFMFLQKRICPFMFLQKKICPFMFLQKKICPFHLQKQNSCMKVQVVAETLLSLMMTYHSLPDCILTIQTCMTHLANPP
ncbi:uncharacterized protein [Hoplias malabaricus]|uniref:uncharacterized protein n=1 Tax=Hoplias malabaricus TaxID=27720 RepID=UPI003461DAA4